MPEISLSAGTRSVVLAVGALVTKDIIASGGLRPVPTVPLHHIRDADLQRNRWPPTHGACARDIHQSLPISRRLGPIPHDFRTRCHVARDDLDQASDGDANTAAQVHGVPWHSLG